MATLINYKFEIAKYTHGIGAEQIASGQAAPSAGECEDEYSPQLEFDDSQLEFDFGNSNSNSNSNQKFHSQGTQRSSFELFQAQEIQRNRFELFQAIGKAIEKRVSSLQKCLTWFSCTFEQFLFDKTEAFVLSLHRMGGRILKVFHINADARVQLSFVQSVQSLGESLSFKTYGKYP